MAFGPSLRLEPPEPPERLECPDCGETLTEDKQERSVTCESCGFWDGFDWDAAAEARMEARMDDERFPDMGID